MANFWTLREYDSGVGTIETGQTPLGRTTDVESYDANGYGLYDMHGNVIEWCRDWFADFPFGPAFDPVGPNIGITRVFRGGYWSAAGRLCRSAVRLDSYPHGAGWDIGFRVVLAPSQ